MSPQLAAPILTLLFLFVGIFMTMIVIEFIKAIRQFLDTRATSAEWVPTDNPGLLDYEADGERAIKRFTKELKQIATDTLKLAKNVVRYTKQMNDLAKSGKTAKGIDKQKRGNAIGSEITQSAIYIEKRTQLFDALTKDVIRNYNGLIDSMNIVTEEDRHAAEILLNSLDAFDSSISFAVSSMGEYRKIVKELEQRNLSRVIREATKRLADGLGKMIDCFSKFQNETRKLGEKLRTKLTPKAITD